MVRGNNQIPNQHFKKKWHQIIGVRTWFNQQARKVRRRNGALFCHIECSDCVGDCCK